MNMFKKVTGLAAVSMLALGLTGHKAEAAYSYVGSDTPNFVMKNNDANQVGNVHYSTGGNYQVRLPAQKITKYPSGETPQLIIELYEMDGTTKDKLVDMFVVRGKTRLTSPQTLTTFNAGNYTDGTNKKAEIKAYYNTNYSAFFTAKFYD